ncbi:TPA: hypothetical protein N0F65_001242 [Lagenidium giganteum]|uniref:Kinesin motor domain-containing protein n=1 Tax=Lagenidium giganteum TaxID=4803 RepID=A0AAV2YUT3_9STRA|nr:TPA: hypothetical protein N0F65_001242 [Lagenidium giganteum]
MSPGVASITFERVFDASAGNAPTDLFQHSIGHGVCQVVRGFQVSIMAAGAAASGKSFVVHGDRGNQAPGLIELCIAQVFEELRDSTDAQLFVGFFASSLGGELLHLAPSLPSVTTDVIQQYRYLSQPVHSEDEALGVYEQARQLMTQAQGVSFAMVLSVETTDEDGTGRCCGQLVCVDPKDNAIVEPTVVVDGKSAHFADTHFPVERVLTKHFGQCLGNNWNSFVVVSIRTPAQFQQQAIQSLLYACKAKDIYSQCKPNVVKAVAALSSPASSPKVLPLSTHEADDVDTTPNDVSTGYQRKIVAERIHKAYQFAKTASQSTSNEVHTNVSEMGHELDAMLLRAGVASPPTSLMEKMSALQGVLLHLEKKIESESSIKEKCVDRISKLSQTMSFQVVEHEKHVQQLEQENAELEQKLHHMENKCTQVAETVQHLEAEVMAMRARQATDLSSSPSELGGNERALLQKFSSRLEAAMEEAKGVVQMKDEVILTLEMRVKELINDNEASRDAWKKQESGLNTEIQTLNSRVEELGHKLEQQQERMSEELARLQQQKSDLMLKVTKVNLEAESLRKSLIMREEHAQDALATVREETQEHMEQQLHETNQQLAQLRYQLAYERSIHKAVSAAKEKEYEALERRLGEELLMKDKEMRRLEKKAKILLRECSAQKSATSAQIQDMEIQLADLAQREQEARAVAFATEKRLEEVLASERQLQDVVVELKQEMLQYTSQLENMRLAMQSEDPSVRLAQQEEQARRRLEDLERTLTQQMLEKEMIMSQQHETQIQELMKRHSEELLSMEMEHLRLRRKNSDKENRKSNDKEGSLRSSCSSSSSSRSTTSLTSPATAYEQKSLDELDSLLQRTNKRSTRQRSCSSKSDAALQQALLEREEQVKVLRERNADLTRALAIANEQETMAKDQIQRSMVEQQSWERTHDQLQEELNKLKQENWSLTLALQVTERTNASRKGLLTS